MEFQRLRKFSWLIIIFILLLIVYPKPKNVKENGYIVLGNDFSKWFSEQKIGSYPYYSAQLFYDGNQSGFSSETDGNALNCLSSLKIGKKTDNVKIEKGAGHIIDLSIIIQDDNNEVILLESKKILFSNDFSYVTIAYHQEKGVYKVLNKSEISSFFELYSNKNN